MINLGALNSLILMKGDGAKPEKAAPPAAQAKPGRADMKKFCQEIPEPYQDSKAVKEVCSGKGAGRTVKMLDYDGKPVEVKVRGRQFDPNPYADQVQIGGKKGGRVRHFDNYDGTPSNVTAGGHKKTRHFDPYPEK